MSYFYSWFNPPFIHQVTCYASFHRKQKDHIVDLGRNTEKGTFVFLRRKVLNINLAKYFLPDGLLDYFELLEKIKLKRIAYIFI
jgi:hypothetical protein